MKRYASPCEWILRVRRSIRGLCSNRKKERGVHVVVEGGPLLRKAPLGFNGSEV